MTMKLRTLRNRGSALALAACATGPDYRAASRSAPRPPLRSSWRRARRWFPTRSLPAIGGACIDDPVLDGLVRDALAANTDVRVAVARLAKARARLCARNGALASRRSALAGARNTAASPGRAIPGREAHATCRSMSGSTSPMKSTCSGASGRRDRSRARRSRRGRTRMPTRCASRSSPTRSAPMPMRSPSAERIAVAERIVALLDQSLTLTERRHPGRTCQRPRYRADRRASRPAAGRNPRAPGQRQSALFRLATLTGRTPRELPGRRGCRAPRPCGSTSRSRSATARRCSPAVPTFARPSGGWRPRQRGSASPPPISIRASRSADRSDRAAAGTRQYLQRQPADLAGWPADQLDRQPHRCAGAGRRAPRPTRRRRWRHLTGPSSRRWRRPKTALSNYRRRSVAATRLRDARDQADDGRADHARASARRRHQLARTAGCRAHRGRSRSRAGRGRREYRSVADRPVPVTGRRMERRHGFARESKTGVRRIERSGVLPTLIWRRRRLPYL